MKTFFKALAKELQELGHAAGCALRS